MTAKEQQRQPVVLAGAMDVETDRLIGALAQPERAALGPWKCVRGSLYGYPAVVVRTNQGMANAAAAIALALERFQPRAVLVQGTSGGHDPALHAGDLVIGRACINMGAFFAPPAAAGAGVRPEAWQPLGLERANDQAGDGPKDTVFPADPALLAAARRAAHGFAAARVTEGVLGSADQWNNELDRIAWLHQTWGVSAEEMETAAAAQICAGWGVPFLGVRVLSNSAVHDEPFDPETAQVCQQFTLEVVRAYLAAAR